MSEETKNTAPQPQEPETAPETEPVKEAQTAEDGQKSGTVVQVFQKGYKIGDRIIRHATVVVAE